MGFFKRKLHSSWAVKQAHSFDFYAVGLIDVYRIDQSLALAAMQLSIIWVFIYV